VLAKEDDTLCGLTTPVEEVDGAASGATLYPNPVRSGSSIFLSEALPANAEVEVLDAGGRTALRSQLRAGNVELPLGSALHSGHYVVLLRSANRVEHHRLLVQ
jgi:hypothetical protein